MVGKKKIIAEAHKRFLREYVKFSKTKDGNNQNKQDEAAENQEGFGGAFRESARPAKRIKRKQMV